MRDEEIKESFEAFKNSFSYGSRSDLNFKFLKGLSEEEAAQFFQELLWKFGDFYDHGDPAELVEHVYTWQVQSYAGPSHYVYEDGPFSPFSTPMREARLGLLTSSGHFLTGQDPEPFGVPHMTQEEAVRRVSEFLKTEPELSPVPVDTPPADLQVRHGGYDIRGAQADPEVVLPLKTLRELENEGRFGSLHDPAYTFVGAAAQRRLLKGAGPKWVNMFQAAQLDGVLLVPV